MKHEIEKQPKKFFVGIPLRTNNQEAGSTISAHWERFYREQILQKIPNRVGDDVYGIYTDYESDFNGPYTLLIGCEVSSLKNLPAGLVGREIPEAKYAVYTSQGPFPQGLIAVWQAIWKANLKRAYTHDFEFYSHKFNPQKNPNVKVYIAIE
ncbi:MAG: GyrI-like domain-containing protein [Parachlamydiales bacterium]|nr:GyrI-like domain-containing protein [Parachlamydiales bacterium]